MPTAKTWFILTTRFGTDVRDPSPTVLRAALEEVVDPAHARDTEHTGAFAAMRLR